jgi:hypothetical protein
MEPWSLLWGTEKLTVSAQFDEETGKRVLKIPNPHMPEKDLLAE